LSAIFVEHAQDSAWSYFRRREHRCRLSKMRISHREMQFVNFNALLHDDRYILDFCARIDCSPTISKFLRFFSRAADIDQGLYGLHAEIMFFCDGEVMTSLKCLGHQPIPREVATWGFAYCLRPSSHAIEPLLADTVQTGCNHVDFPARFPQAER